MRRIFLHILLLFNFKHILYFLILQFSRAYFMQIKVGIIHTSILRALSFHFTHCTFVSHFSNVFREKPHLYIIRFLLRFFHLFVTTYVRVNFLRIN